MSTEKRIRYFPAFAAGLIAYVINVGWMGTAYVQAEHDPAIIMMNPVTYLLNPLAVLVTGASLWFPSLDKAISRAGNTETSGLVLLLGLPLLAVPFWGFVAWCILRSRDGCKRSFFRR